MVKKSTIGRNRASRVAWSWRERLVEWTGVNRIIAWIGKKWRALLRDIDLEMLWPTCKRQAEEAYERPIMGQDEALDWAKAAFMMHCTGDPAWTTDMDRDQIAAVVQGLK